MACAGEVTHSHRYVAELLDTATTALGNALWYFTYITCPEFDTFETASEYAKRQRQQAATTSSTSTTAPPTASRQPRQFSLKTIKLHFLGDYVSCIRTFGTTDNYNSAIVCWVLSMFWWPELTQVRGRIVITGSNSTLSHGQITRAQNNNSGKWTTWNFMSAELRMTSGELEFLFLGVLQLQTPSWSHEKRLRLVLQKGTSPRSIFHTGYVITVTTLL